MDNYQYVFPSEMPSFEPASFPEPSQTSPSVARSSQIPIDTRENPLHPPHVGERWETVSTHRRHLSVPNPGYHPPVNVFPRNAIIFRDLPVDGLEDDDEYQDSSGSEPDSDADAKIDNAEVRAIFWLVNQSINEYLVTACRQSFANDYQKARTSVSCPECSCHNRRAAPC
jgi:hypothetical protein